MSSKKVFCGGDTQTDVGFINIKAIEREWVHVCVYTTTADNITTVCKKANLKHVNK